MMQCSVQGATDPVQITWFRNEDILAGEGNEMLLLRNVSRRQSGVYRCQVNNSYGISTSDVINLNVDCKLLYNISQPTFLPINNRVLITCATNEIINVRTKQDLMLFLLTILDGFSLPDDYDLLI